MIFAVQKFQIFIESNFNFVVSDISTCYCLIGRQGLSIKGSKSKDVIELKEVELSSLGPRRVWLVQGSLADSPL